MTLGTKSGPALSNRLRRQCVGGDPTGISSRFLVREKANGQVVLLASPLFCFQIDFFHFMLNTYRQRNECKVPMGCRAPLMTVSSIATQCRRVKVGQTDGETDIGPQQIGLPRYGYASSGKNNNIQHVMFNSLVFIKQLQLQQTTLRRG